MKWLESVAAGLGSIDEVIASGNGDGTSVPVRCARISAK
jgi:hypothetical protein